MDETTLRYDMPVGRAVSRKGDKTILIKTTGHAEDHLTVVLSCLADGTGLPPFVIFKRKSMPQDAVPKCWHHCMCPPKRLDGYRLALLIR